MPLEIRGAHFLIRSAQLLRKTRLEQALTELTKNYSVFSVGMAFSLHFVFYLILYISALLVNKRVHLCFQMTTTLLT